MAKISVVITTYNRPSLLLNRSLKSALKQDFSDYEVVVVDDCSSEPLNLPVNPKIRYYKFSTNKGLAYARNYGIISSTGKYVVCLDDDNELMPNFLKETCVVLDSHQELQAVATGRIMQYKDFAYYLKPKLSSFTSIDWGWLIRREVFNQIQYDEAMRANEDTDFGIQFFKRFKEASAAVLPEPLCVAYDSARPEDSLSFPTKRELDGMNYFFDKNFHEYKGFPNELRHLYRTMGRKFYRGGYKLKGLGYFVKSFWAYPTLHSFAHLFFVLFGWFVYDKFMTLEEKIGASKRSYDI